MTIYVYSNYYRDGHPKRRQEIDDCCKAVVSNPHTTPIILLEPGVTPPVYGVRSIDIAKRPDFQTFFSIVEKTSGDDDINVILNGDCFLDNNDTVRLNEIQNDEAWCLSRVEIKKASPLKVDKHKTARYIRKHGDMQDAWIFRGKPKQSMFLDFTMGKPGCDNRIAWEFFNAGYRIANPSPFIKLYHYHATAVRRYGEPQRVPPPYAYPPRIFLAPPIEKIGAESK